MAGLRESGYIPGQNLLIECRWTEARAERAPALAAELLSLKPDLIVVIGLTAGVRATKQRCPHVLGVLRSRAGSPPFSRDSRIRCAGYLSRPGGAAGKRWWETLGFQ